MNQKLINVLAVVVGLVGGIVGTSLTLIGRVEARVEREVTVRVKQAVLEKELEAQDKRWWLQQGDIESLRSDISSLRLEMARTHAP